MTEPSDWADLVLYCIWMESAKLSARTITDRLALLRRLQRFLEADIVAVESSPPSAQRGALAGLSSPTQGVDTTLHSLRHSFATWAARTTRDPLLVRDLLGHSSVATTEIYMASAATEAQSRLTELSALAGDVLGSARLAHSA